MKDEANILKLIYIKTLTAKIGEIFQKLGGIEAKLSNPRILNMFKAHFGVRIRKTQAVLSLNCGTGACHKNVFKSEAEKCIVANKSLEYWVKTKPPKTDGWPRGGV